MPTPPSPRPQPAAQGRQAVGRPGLQGWSPAAAGQHVSDWAPLRWLHKHSPRLRVALARPGRGMLPRDGNDTPHAAALRRLSPATVAGFVGAAWTFPCKIAHLRLPSPAPTSHSAPLPCKPIALHSGTSALKTSLSAQYSVRVEPAPTPAAGTTQWAAARRSPPAPMHAPVLPCFMPCLTHSPPSAAALQVLRCGPTPTCAFGASGCCWCPTGGSMWSCTTAGCRTRCCRCGGGAGGAGAGRGPGGPGAR